MTAPGTTIVAGVAHPCCAGCGRLAQTPLVHVREPVDVVTLLVWSTGLCWCCNAMRAAGLSVDAQVAAPRLEGQA